LLVWNLWRRDDRPRECLGVCAGMTVESAAFALGLLCLSQLLLPVLQTVGQLLEAPTVRVTERLTPLATGPAAATAEFAWEQIVGYVGAGIYEETLFRLLVFAGLVALFTLMDLPRWLGLTVAAVASALLFAGAHSLGPHGEPFQLVIFLFRTCAGVYFAWIYHVRGFGIAVGAHASYDVLVGTLMRSV
jgi:membrane protease YdiL (CAAX protease family)